MLLPHSHHMLVMFPSYARHISTILSPYSHHISTISLSYFHHIPTMSSSYSRHILIIFPPYPHRILTILSPYSHPLLTICSPNLPGSQPLTDKCLPISLQAAGDAVSDKTQEMRHDTQAELDKQKATHSHSSLGGQ